MLNCALVVYFKSQKYMFWKLYLQIILMIKNATFMMFPNTLLCFPNTPNACQYNSLYTLGLITTVEVI